MADVSTDGVGGQATTLAKGCDPCYRCAFRIALSKAHASTIPFPFLNRRWRSTRLVTKFNVCLGRVGMGVGVSALGPIDGVAVASP
jgi:hypothetical protein